MGFSDSPMCECGEDQETIEHVLMFCNRYNVDRILFKHKIGNYRWNLTTVLYPEGGDFRRVKDGNELQKHLYTFLKGLTI